MVLFMAFWKSVGRLPKKNYEKSVTLGINGGT